MAVVYLLIIGAAAGFLATRALRIEADIPTTVAIGVGGALVGWLVWRLLLVVTGWLGGFVAALGGAFLLIWLWQRFIRRSAGTERPDHILQPEPARARIAPQTLPLPGGEQDRGGFAVPFATAKA